MACGNLDTDSCKVFRDNRIVEAHNIDALVQKLCGHLLAKFCIVEHNGADSALGWLDVEAGFLHLVNKVCRVLMELVLQTVGAAHHVEHLYAGCCNHRRDGVGEKVRA